MQSQNLQNTPRRNRYSASSLVRPTQREKRDGHGHARLQSRGTFPEVRTEIQLENSANAGRPNDSTNRVHSLAALPAPGHQARQLSHGAREETTLRVRDRLRADEEVPRLADRAAHSLQGWKELDGDGQVRESEHSHRHRIEQER